MTAILSRSNWCESLQWCHNGLDGVSNHQPHHCLLSRLFGRWSKKTSKLHVTGLCVGNSPHKWPVTRKMFPFDDVIMGWGNSGRRFRWTRGHFDLQIELHPLGRQTFAPLNPWWRHQMETSCVTGPLCGEFTGEFPSWMPVTRSFDIIIDLFQIWPQNRILHEKTSEKDPSNVFLNKRLSKQSRRRWFETPSRSVWRHCNEWGYNSGRSFDLQSELHPLGRQAFASLDPWWCHQMETFSPLRAQRPASRIFDVFFDLCLNKRLIE